MIKKLSFVKRDDSKLLLSLEEAADLLGMCSKTLAKKAAVGTVPAINLGEPGGRRYWRFSRTRLEAWAAEGEAF